MLENPDKKGQNLLDSVFESAIDGIIIIDEKGTINRINQSACSLFSFSKEELLGKNVSQLMPRPHATQHDQYLSKYQETGEKKIIGIGREVDGQRKDGTLFPIKLSVSEFQIEEKTYYTGVIHDLSAQKGTELKLQNLARNLENLVQARTGQLQESVDQLSATNKDLEDEIDFRIQVEQILKVREKELLDSLEKERDLGILKSRFVSIASHEFRTPLANILSSISLIQKYDTPDLLEKRNIHIEKIKKNIHYLSGILNEFLIVTRIEEGKFELKLSEFSLTETIQEIIEDFSVLKKPDQKILFKHDPAIDFTIESDPSCLKHIINNIVSNAIKYSNAGSTIQVELEKIQNQYRIQVEDEGIGIPEEEMKFIFDIFFRGTNVLNIQGTGLGLNIVKKYLDNIQGHIKFEHRKPNGTIVTIILPEHVKKT